MVLSLWILKIIEGSKISLLFPSVMCWERCQSWIGSSAQLEHLELLLLHFNFYLNIVLVAFSAIVMIESLVKASTCFKLQDEAPGLVNLCKNLLGLPRPCMPILNWENLVKASLKAKVSK